MVVTRTCGYAHVLCPFILRYGSLRLHVLVPLAPAATVLYPVAHGLVTHTTFACGLRGYVCAVGLRVTRIVTFAVRVPPAVGCYTLRLHGLPPRYCHAPLQLRGCYLPYGCLYTFTGYGSFCRFGSRLRATHCHGLLLDSAAVGLPACRYYAGYLVCWLPQFTRLPFHHLRLLRCAVTFGLLPCHVTVGSAYTRTYVRWVRFYTVTYALDTVRRLPGLTRFARLLVTFWLRGCTCGYTLVVTCHYILHTHYACVRSAPLPAVPRFTFWFTCHTVAFPRLWLPPFTGYTPLLPLHVYAVLPRIACRSVATRLPVYTHTYV